MGAPAELRRSNARTGRPPLPFDRSRTVNTRLPLPLPGVGSVLTSDAFTGGDIANIAGRATDVASGGSPATWTVSAGTEIGITSGMLARTSGSTIRRVGFNIGSGDIWARMRVSDIAGVFGSALIQIRCSDVGTVGADRYQATIGSSGSVRLEKVIGGVTTALYTSPALSPGSNPTIGVYAKGTRVGMTFNGAVVFETINAEIASSLTFFRVQIQAAGQGLLDDLIISQL